MDRVKRLRSVCHSIAHHAASGLSWVHPHVLHACDAHGLTSLEVNLLDEDPCPASCRDIEPLKSSLLGLKRRFTEILAAEKIALDDLIQASLTFIRDPAARDDHSTICRAQLTGRHGASVNAVVDGMGNR